MRTTATTRPFATLTPLVRRYRRILAAGCAGLAVLLALTWLRAPASSQALPTGPVIAAGQIAVPIPVESSAIASVVAPGDVVDVVRVPRTGDEVARVVATSATVLSVPGGGGFGASSSPVVLVVVGRTAAFAIADAGGPFTVWLHAPTTGSPTGR